MNTVKSSNFNVVSHLNDLYKSNKISEKDNTLDKQETLYNALFLDSASLPLAYGELESFTNLAEVLLCYNYLSTQNRDLAELYDSLSKKKEDSVFQEVRLLSNYSELMVISFEQIDSFLPLNKTSINLFNEMKLSILLYLLYIVDFCVCRLQQVSFYLVSILMKVYQDEKSTLSKFPNLGTNMNTSKSEPQNHDVF